LLYIYRVEITMSRFTKIACITFLAGSAFSDVGCVIPETKKLPPGQEKKIGGEQSAKDFAPGQEKKDKD
jgi:hypothetical protein